MSFAHLHVHTEYSLLDGSNKISEYIAKVKELGMTAAAITDHGVMYGVIDFYKAARAAGINPVLGCEVYVATGSRFDKDPAKGQERYYHLILLAENNTGYANLIKIVSIGFIDGFYYKPRVDFETLEKYHEGLICLSACLAGEVPRLLSSGQYDKARECALKYEACFGKGNYFLELQDHGIPEQKNVNTDLLRLSEETGIGLVVTNDCHYTNAGDADSHDVLLCVQTGKTINDEDRMRYEGGQYYVKSEEEMRAIFPFAPQAIENTQRIADRCHVEIEFGNTKLPRFDVPEGYDSTGYLKKLCYDGLKDRYGEGASAHEEQLQYELDVIEKMGYVDYFLIVWDFINYARTHGIPVGPGRGSAAGSLVSYTMGITNIDPIRYSLLFERFLNPERVSMPDIDVDFCYEQRGKVINYVVEKYGKDCVTQIVTFGTMKAKMAIRDVGRVLDLPVSFVNNLAKMIPDEKQGFPVSIERAMEMNKELAKRYREEEDVHRILDTAKQLEGLPRQASVHAAGVVISQKPMYEYVPLARGKDDNIVTQFPMTTIEELGLLKMDFLGLRTLTVIADAVAMIEKNHGVKIDVDRIDYDDKNVYEAIASGRDEGIFQLESEGMKNFMKELSPASLEDVIAGISLYRPGPMDFIPAYLKGKNHPETIVYETPELEPILKPTYGCIVYQEQVMQIVRDLAGYSLGRSDLVRRAMSKKKLSVMEEERRRFVHGDAAEGVKGCIANGILEKVADHIFDEMVDFARYAFNKSHAASYAVVAYQTAWLKYYYPAEFFASLLTSVQDRSDKITQYVATCRSMGIEVLPPNINVGEGEFIAVDGSIHYGMYAIKGVGKEAVDEIVKERKANGSYDSLEEFLNRFNEKVRNRRVIENLIKAGALDCLPGNRRQKIGIFGAILDSLNAEKKHAVPGQLSLFDIAGEEEKADFQIRLPDMPEFDRQLLLEYEKDVMGMYVSGHPLDDDRGMLEKNITARSIDFILEEQDESEGRERAESRLSDRQKVVVGGIITTRKLHFTQKDQAMAFLTLEDLYGSMEVIVFPSVFDKVHDILEEDNKVLIRGRVSREMDKDSKLLAEEIITFEELPRELWIQFADRDLYEAKRKQLEGLLEGSSGRDRVVIFAAGSKEIFRMPARWNVKADEAFLESLKEAFGNDNIRLVPGRF